MVKSPRHVALAIAYCEQTHHVLMVTSRKHAHLWICGVEDGETTGYAAVRESYEEAGVPLDVRVPDDADELATLDLPASPVQKRGAVWHVHAVHVASEQDLLDLWMERHERQRAWVSPREALSRIRAWYADPAAHDEVDAKVDKDRSAASTASSGGTKMDAKGGAMESALRAWAAVYGWDAAPKR